ncbi:MAG: SAVED domain-containing protein [Candidatus Lokiarchaeota archaeon]|nr:SAVED domain-containing protein [Candidatus Lokiarchaeota archaeon]
MTLTQIDLYMDDVFRYLYEDYLYLRFQVFAVKSGSEWMIHYLKFIPTSQLLKSDSEVFSINEKILIYEYFIDLKDAHQVIYEKKGRFILDTSKYRFFFLEKLKSPSDLKKFKEELIFGRNWLYKVYKKNKIQIRYIQKLYNEYESSFQDLIHSEMFRINSKIKSSSEMVEETFKIGLPKINPFENPYFIISFPIESFKFDWKIKNKQNTKILSINWQLKDEYKKYILIFYSKSGEKFEVNSENFQIELNKEYEGEIVFSIIWNKSDGLIPKKTLLFEEKIIIKNRNNNSIIKSIKSHTDFIEIDFNKYNLPEYQQIIELIDKIAYHSDFYQMLPILLRILFENIMYDIFEKWLPSSYTDLYFSESHYRSRTFSKLIDLLNIIKDKELKFYHKGAINQSIIDILDYIREKGNLTVHLINRQIDQDFCSNIKEKVNRALEALLLLYKKVRKQEPGFIEEKRLKYIKDKLGMAKDYREYPKLDKKSIEKWILIIQEGKIPINKNRLVNIPFLKNQNYNIIRLKCDIEKKSWKEITMEIERSIEKILYEEKFYKIAVFSLSRISCAIYLGFILTNRVGVKYFQYQRDRDSWNWEKDLDYNDCQKIQIDNLLTKQNNKIEEFTIKISLTADIDDKYIKGLGLNLNDSVEIRVNKPSEESFIVEQQVIELGKLYRKVLKNIRKSFPKLKKIHLFYAGPTAGAIAIGRQINPRMSPLIQLYEFNFNRTPAYKKSILIGGYQD